MRLLYTLLLLLFSAACFCQPKGKLITLHVNGFDTTSIYKNIQKKLDSTNAFNLFQSKGTYLIPNDTLNKWLPKGTLYLKPSDTTNKWQPKGNYLTSQLNADWNAGSGAAQILNKPTIPTNNNQLTNGANYIPTPILSDSLNKRFSQKDTITIVPMGNGQYFFYGDSNHIYQYGVNFFGGSHVSIDSSITSTQKDFIFNVNFSDMHLRMVAPILYPVVGTEIDMGYTPVDLYVDFIAESITGTTPDVTYEINHGDTRNQVDGQIISARHNTATSGGLVPQANYSTLIPAGSFIWLKVTAVNGTPVNFSVTANYHQL